MYLFNRSAEFNRTPNVIQIVINCFFFFKLGIKTFKNHPIILSTYHKNINVNILIAIYIEFIHKKNIFINIHYIILYNNYEKLI